MNSSPPVVVTFALPDESRDFIALLGRYSRGRGLLAAVTGECGGHPMTVVHTGVGQSAASRQRLDDALQSERPSFVISAGYAGGLQDDLRVGDLILGENVSDAGLLASARSLLEGEPWHAGTLLTQSVVAETAAGKSALHAATGALAVDMETGWIAEACARSGVPMLSLRVISDAASQSFPVPGGILFDAARQRPRYVALPLWLLTHPARIRPFFAFVRGLGPARAQLARALSHLLARL